VGRRIRAKGIDRYLADDEPVLHYCRQHPIVLLKPLAVWLVAVTGASAIGFFISPRSGASLVDNLAGGSIVGFTAYAGWKFWQWRTALYVFTDQRVLSKEGILAVKVTSIPLAKVTDTTFTRPVWGRLLGYGELFLDSAGEQDGFSTLSYLPKAEGVYRLLASLLAGSGERPAEPLSSVREYQDPDDTGPLPRVVL